MLRYTWTLLLSLLILFLSGCQTISSPTTKPEATLSWNERVLRLKRIQNWSLEGKIAVQTDQDSGSAAVTWIKQGGQYSISLWGPLGAGGLKLTGQPGAVTLLMADGKTFTATSPEQLLKQRWGFELPVSYLNYWVRGLPVPDFAANKQFDANQRLARLQQQGWHVEYLSYTTNKAGIDLPSRIAITSLWLKTKIVIYQWNVF